jgi:hypothetical protein
MLTRRILIIFRLQLLKAPEISNVAYSSIYCAGRGKSKAVENRGSANSAEKGGEEYMHVVELSLLPFNDVYFYLSI